MKEIPAFVTAVGAILNVFAIALFSLTGSGFGGAFLFGLAGLVVGMVLASLLTSFPRRGRLAAAFRSPRRLSGVGPGDTGLARDVRR